MRTDNIFVTGGEVCGESMIGYENYSNQLYRILDQRIYSTGGVYLYGLYRMGKTSLIKKVNDQLKLSHPDLISVFQNINLLNKDDNTNSFSNLLSAIVRKIEQEIRKLPDEQTKDIKDAIAYFKEDPPSSQDFREDFNYVFECIKNAGKQVLLILDEFDAARQIFQCKADFELFRTLTASTSYSVCLVTVSRQELSMIEYNNPNNSSFKGVMHPFPICGFDAEDIEKFKEVLYSFYNCNLSEENIHSMTFYCGASPYLWSFFGFHIAEKMIHNEIAIEDLSIEEIYHHPVILSKMQEYHDSIFKCLSRDIDINGNSYIDKMVGIILGPSFLASSLDIDMLKQLNYLIDTGSEYITISKAFKSFLFEQHYNNDILNNFEMLEKKLKLVLDEKKEELTAIAGSTASDENQKWYDILQRPWKNSFDPGRYESQIRSTFKKFRKTESALDVMSLEDATKIILSYWTVFAPFFNNDSKDKWKVMLEECGKARNPVHHNSRGRLYTKEEQFQINSYCCEIIKQLS